MAIITPSLTMPQRPLQSVKLRGIRFQGSPPLLPMSFWFPKETPFNTVLKALKAARQHSIMSDLKFQDIVNQCHQSDPNMDPKEIFSVLIKLTALQVVKSKCHDETAMLKQLFQKHFGLCITLLYHMARKKPLSEATGHKLMPLVTEHYRYSLTPVGERYADAVEAGELTIYQTTSEQFNLVARNSDLARELFKNLYPNKK